MQLNLLDSLYAAYTEAAPLKSESSRRGRSYIKAVIVISCTLLKEPSWKQLQALNVESNHWPGVNFNIEDLNIPSWPSEAQTLYTAMALSGKVDWRTLTLTVLNSTAGRNETEVALLYTARTWIYDSDSLPLNWFLTGSIKGCFK